MTGLSIDLATVAHGVHLGLLAGGLLGLVVLLGPHLAAPRPGTRTDSAPRDEHQRRVRVLAGQVAAGTLGTELTPYVAPVAPVAPVPRDRRASLLLPVAVVGSAAAAGVHAAVFPGHLREGVLLGLFFAASATAQLAWAVLVVVRPTTALLRAGAVGNLAAVGLWLTTRTVGLGPLLPDPERVGPWDLCCGAWEVVTAVACLAALGAGTAPVARWDEWRPAARTFAVGSVLALGALSVSGAGA